MNLFSQDQSESRRAADSAEDQIREKFGDRAIMRGTFVNQNIDHMQGGIRSNKDGDNNYIMMGGKRV